MTIKELMLKLIKEKIEQKEGFELLYPLFLNSQGETLLNSISDETCIEILKSLLK